MKRGTGKNTIKKKHVASKVTLKKKRAAVRKQGKEWNPDEVKAKLKERINHLSGSGKATIRLKWIVKSISEIDEKKVVQKVVTRGNYGPVDAQQKTEIEKYIKSTQMTIDQALSLRSARLRQKSFERHPFLRREAKSALGKYKMGHTALDLARTFDQPPMNVFRVILSEMKWSKNQIKNALRDPTKFEGRELNEYLALKPMDIVATEDKKTKERAGKFEDIVSVWLERKGIRFVREEQLQKEQEKEFSKAIATPDFLLLDQVSINGTPCHWIDCKSYYGADVYLDVDSTKKQKNRYVNNWGSGAIIYLQGFCETIKTKIRGCTLLNAYGNIDIDLLRQLHGSN